MIGQAATPSDSAAPSQAARSQLRGPISNRSKTPGNGRKSSAANVVEMTLYCASDAGGETLTPVSTELQPSLARELAIRLWLAADQTEDPAK